MSDLSKLTIEEAKTGLEKREFSAVDLLKDCLEQIHKHDPALNAFITVDEENALKEAKKADEKLKDPNLDQNPLLGIPIAAKDLYSTKNLRTTAGSKVLEDYVPVYDATAIERLKNAGAIIIGKTNLDAWGHGASGENSDFGPSKNPWNLDYVPGGSSSGSAVAVASGMSLGAMGTDTGGSIRLPASFCNLVGLKPTYGRVSRYGIIAMASSLDSIGHFTKTVTDSALILKVTAGFDGKDATCPPIEVDDYLGKIKNGVRGLKIGIPKEYLVEGINPQVVEKTKEAIKIFENLGAEIFDVSLPNIKYANPAYYIIQPAEVSSNLGRYDGIRFGFDRSKFSAEAKRRIMLGTYTLSAGYYDAYYVKAMKVRTLIKNDFEKVFEDVDCLLAPVSPTPPFKLGEKTNDPLEMYLSDILTVMANLAGIPALAIPAGFVDELPVGVQLISQQFNEDLLFRAGYAFEQITKYFEKTPKL